VHHWLGRGQPHHVGTSGCNAICLTLCVTVGISRKARCRHVNMAALVIAWQHSSNTNCVCGHCTSVQSGWNAATIHDEPSLGSCLPTAQPLHTRWHWCCTGVNFGGCISRCFEATLLVLTLLPFMGLRLPQVQFGSHHDTVRRLP
jgi:hypothetical protein